MFTATYFSLKTNIDLQRNANRMANWKKLLLMLFLGIVWGTTWIAIKYSLVSVPPFLGAALRFAVAFVVLGIYAFINGISLKLPSGALKYILISAFLLYIPDYGGIYWAEQSLYAGVTAIFFASYPIFTGLIANFWFKEEAFSWHKFAGLLLGFIGILTIFYDQLLITQFDTMVTWASITVIFGAFCGALSVLTVKKYLHDTPVMPLTLHQMFWGIGCLSMLALFRGEFTQASFSWSAFWAILYLGIIGTAIAFVSYFYLLKRMSAVSLSYIIYLNPIVAIIGGWLLLGEEITPRIAIGTLIVLSGIAVFQMRKNKGEKVAVEQ